MITLLDYGAGNVRSVRNAIKRLGYEVQDVSCPADIIKAQKLVFPGVGSFGSAMHRLADLGYIEPLLNHLRANKPFLGICLGLQTLFESSEESPGVPGLGVIPGAVSRFADPALSVPQIGWNGVNRYQDSALFTGYQNEKLYFVHSYRA
ncbi:MAG: imidazole glycerol phosphate synthase subunit HisH, partial [Rectinemataceae bacterium]|nr:imidazole glycerol phosphate synthase subunit HisH [Rectinemataceae bacterium]